MNYIERQKEKERLKKQLHQMKETHRKEEQEIEKRIEELNGTVTLKALGLDLEKVSLAREIVYFEKGLKNMKPYVLKKAMEDIFKGAKELTNQKRTWHNDYSYSILGKELFNIKLKPIEADQPIEEPFDLSKEELESVYEYLNQLRDNRAFYREEKKYIEEKQAL